MRSKWMAFDAVPLHVMWLVEGPDLVMEVQNSELNSAD